MSQDITTYLVEETHPELMFEELCTGIGRFSSQSIISISGQPLKQDR